jgi:hypothetical protein
MSTPSNDGKIKLAIVTNTTPWKDPAYTFPLTTFTVPADSTITIPDLGSPSMAPGSYDLGIYVHYSTTNGQFAPGDQVIAKTSFTFFGLSAN